MGKLTPGPVHLHGFRGAAGDVHGRPAFLFLLLDVGLCSTGTVAPHFPEGWLSSTGLVAQSTPE